MTAREWKQMFESREFEEKYTYAGNDLGAVYEKEKTTFKVWAPTAEKVMLHLYTAGSTGEAGEKELLQVEMKKREQGIYEKQVKGDLHGVYYTFSVTVDGETRETGDIYAKAAGVNGKRSMVVDLEKTNPKGWEEDTHVFHPLGKTWVWEVHIGDFSNDPASGVREEYRGKYLAFTENTTLNQDGVHPTCVNYLKELGITHVHLLPSFDYGSVDESKCNTFNWGYDPVNYNVPEGSYATDAFHGEVRIREFKEMVAALHKAGISVVMDVVYNHTHSLDSFFNATVPYYYYRTWEDGTYSDGSACGNDTASDRAMFRKYMMDSVLHWVQEYHVDGFRFDLMGLHDTQTMNEIRKALNELEDGEQIFLYGEPWSAGPSALKESESFATKEAMKKLAEGIAVFNDDTRDAVKGPYDKLEVPGFVNGKKGLEEKIKRGIQGLFDEKEKVQPVSPAQLLNYVSAHDNSTLWDKLVDSVKKDQDYETRHEDLLAMNKLAAAIVQFSAGIPFMQAGEEAGRTKQGEDNSYNLSKELNRLDWNRMYKFQDLISYYKGLHEVRNQFSGFYDLSEKARTRQHFYENLPEGIIAYEMEGIRGTDQWEKVVVIFHASQEPTEFVLGNTGYKRIVSPSGIDLQGVYLKREKAKLDESGAYVFVK
ncbi:MAG: type I pullulanase [Firmicutes bacterium]|mgnify:FL=1|nr:type I pullulanase [Bacillota bacterium]